MSEVPTADSSTQETHTVGDQTDLSSQEGKRALRQLLAPVRGQMLFGRVMAVLSAVCGVFPYVALVGVGNELTNVLHTNTTVDVERVHFWLMVLLVSYCCRLAFYFVGLMVTHIADVTLGASIQTRIIHQLSEAPLGWFSENTSGHVRKILQDDVKNLHMLVAHRPVDVTVSILLPLFCGTYTFIIDWRLGLLVILSVPIYAIAYGIMMRGFSSKTIELDQKLDAVSSAMVEFIQGIQVVKTFGIVGKAHRRYADAATGACDYHETWSRPMVNAASVTSAIVSAPLIVLVVGFGGAQMTAHGWVSMVEVIVATLIAIALPQTINLVATMAWSYQLAGAAARRIIDVVSIEPMPLPENPVSPSGIASVECVDVSVSYGEVQSLKHVSMTCQPGTTTALVGPSGAGKSTLAKLIARFLDPDEGTVMIGGVNVKQMTQEDLYKTVSFVMQDAQLIRASMRDNIAMGRPSATQAEIEQAARQAQIHDDILAMPKGYDTVFGEDIQLSGGQQQRISIARAMILDAPILVLDEAVAMVDPECEAQIQEAINTLTEDRTVIVIDHRPASIMHTDQIVLLDGGEVVGRGTHQELRTIPLYRRLWESSGAEEEV